MVFLESYQYLYLSSVEINQYEAKSIYLFTHMRFLCWLSILVLFTMILALHSLSHTHTHLFFFVFQKAFCDINESKIWKQFLLICHSFRWRKFYQQVVMRRCRLTTTWKTGTRAPTLLRTQCREVIGTNKSSLVIFTTLQNHSGPH